VVIPLERSNKPGFLSNFLTLEESSFID